MCVCTQLPVVVLFCLAGWALSLAVQTHPSIGQQNGWGYEAGAHAIQFSQ